MTIRWPVGVALLLSLAGCSRSDPPSLWKISGRTMGSTFTVTIADPTASLASHPPDVDAIAKEIEDALEDIARQMSTYRPDSEISKFNASRSTDPIPVSLAFAKVVAKAVEIYKLSGGRYDVTVAPLVELWGFGPARKRDKPPSEAEIDAAKADVGSDKIQVTLDPPAIRKSVPTVRIDLNSIAPGFAVDLLCEILNRRGLTNYLVDVGGEFRARGRNDKGDVWRVGVERPERGGSPGRDVQDVVELSDEALATSGDYRNYFEFNGKFYSHTIDPTTGRTAMNELASVTVVAPDCITADGLATAVMALGPEKGGELIESIPGIRAIMLLRAGEHEFHERKIPADRRAANRPAQ